MTKSWLKMQKQTDRKTTVHNTQHRLTEQHEPNQRLRLPH